MTDHIKVTQEVFNEMKKCGDWDSTTSVLIEAIGYVPAAVWDQEIDSDRSYQDDEKAFIVGGRTGNRAIVTIEK